MSQMLTVKEAADLLGLRPSTLRKWIFARRLDVVRVGSRAVRIRRATLEALIRRGERRAVEPAGR